jgi:hypothetical protein
MTQVQKLRRQSQNAGSRELSETDAATVPSETARMSTANEPAGIARSIGARPRSEVTSGHDVGSDANETVDGLTSTEEAIRRGAEDTPIGAPEQELEELPVFDRGDALPKV